MRWAIRVLLSLGLAPIAGAAPSNPADYFPLTDGASWTYAVEGGGFSTVAVQPGTLNIGGVLTKELRDTAGVDVGSKGWFSNSAGVRLHREFYADDSATVNYTPAITLASNPFDLGTAATANGTLVASMPGSGNLAGTWSQDWEIVARGPMQTPAGFFCDAVRRHETFAVSIGGEGFSSTSDQYFVRGLGLVAEAGTEDGEVYFYTLTSTTLPLPPANRDCDGLADSVDNCPFHASPNTTDADGDGRGDVCECGDQNGDGRNTVADLVAINLAIFNPSLATPLCDANNDGQCNVGDIVAANVEIFTPTSTSVCSRQPVPGP
jgi:hypothetical protein